MNRFAIRSWSLLLVLAAAAPAYAQEEPAADPAADPAAADAAPADAAGPADGSVPYDGSADTPAESAPADAPAEAAPAESAPIETIPVAEADPAEEPPPAAEEEGEPWNLYAGFDLVNTTVTSDAGDAGSGLYRLRFGRKLYDQIALEFQYGLDNGGDGAGEVSTDSYYGLFFVPTATMLDTVELHFPIGYALNKVGDRSLNSIAYGVNLELPLRAFGAELPDFRFGAGWMVYGQTSSGQIYGPNFGLRYDFTTASLGNPFGWIGDIDLWPFGDDDKATDAQ